MAEEKGTVLIFEDNPSIQQLLRFFFQKRGFTPVVADDGVDAVRLAGEHAPKLIMMDLIMPGKDGIETTGDLRRAGVTAPIVMLTSKPFESDRERAQAAGVTTYLLKPFNPPQLEAAIKPFVGA